MEDPFIEARACLSGRRCGSKPDRHPGLVPGSAWRHHDKVEIERNPCVYILARSFHGTLYTGATSNLIGRVIQHREGRFDGFTKRYAIHILVYYEAADTMEAAILREKQIKRWPREFKYNLIERENPAWNDLAVGLGLPPLSHGSRRGGPRHKAGVTVSL